MILMESTMKPDNSIYIMGGDLKPTAPPTAAACASLVIAKTMEQKSDFSEGKFLRQAATRIIPGDMSGYLSVGGMLVVYGPDNEATEKIIGRRNPMLIVLSEGGSGKAKKAAPNGCVVLTLDKDTDVSYRVIDGAMCSKTSKSSKWTPVNKQEPKAKPEPKAKVEAKPAP